LLKSHPTQADVVAFRLLVEPDAASGLKPPRHLPSSRLLRIFLF
jgi:hypothetical protein